MMHGSTAPPPSGLDDPRLYLRMARQLRGQIDDGSLKRGDPTPPISDLCRQTGLSRRTVGRALQLLECEGLLVRVPGRGYYVVGRNE